MILEKGKNNRFLVYFFFDKDGKVDRYIDYMLQEMSKCVRDILIISNGNISDDGKKVFEKYTDRIVERENKGFDVGAYKDALNIVGWENLCEYDEVILMNYTIMGPVYPLQIMFDSMDERDIDYWGPTISHKTDFDPFGTVPFGYLPDHIQTHFLAIRNTLLVSKAFRDYWRKMPLIESYQQSVGRHEAYFTKHFADMGYKWDVYANSEVYRELTYQPCLTMATEMIRDQKLPFFKRRSFMQDYTVVLSECVGQHGKMLYDYLENETNYDTNLIWDNLLRVENMADLKRNLQLNYILPSKYTVNPNVEHKKIALIMHMYFPDLIDECLHYAKSMPDYADIYITTNSEEKKCKIVKAFSVLPNKVDVRVTPNRGRDVGPFLVESKEYIYDYDYICHTHDKKVGQLKPLTIGQAFSYRCFENVLATPEFVENIIDLFENNPRMGIIMPPPPNHSEYFFTLGLEWGSNYEVTCELAKKLNVNAPMSDTKEPISPLGSVFWARTDALHKVFDYPWTYEELPEEPIDDDGTVLHAVERMYSFSAQDMGYYAGWIFCDSGAEIEMTNMYYMMRTINEKLMRNYGICGSHQSVLAQLSEHMPLSSQYKTATLYYDDGSGFKQQHTIVSSYEKEDSGIKWTFEGLQACGDITALRFDPGEAGNIELSGISVIINEMSGNKIVFKENQLSFNGARIHKRFVFIKDDPNIMIDLKRKILIDSVEVKVQSISEISDDTKNVILKRL